MNILLTIAIWFVVALSFGSLTLGVIGVSEFILDLLNIRED